MDGQARNGVASPKRASPPRSAKDSSRKVRGGRVAKGATHSKGRKAAQSASASTKPPPSRSRRPPKPDALDETSSPELTELLNEYRQKVILPTYLVPEQRKKIYKRRLEKYLVNDPVTMEIDGVVHKFRYVDVTKDVPSTPKTWAAALRLMQTPADFANIRPLLEGLKRAHRALTPAMQHRMVRWAGAHAAGGSGGALQVVLDAARSVRRTGFALSSSELVGQVLLALQGPAINGGWSEAETRTALKRVRGVLDMLESDEAHAPRAETAGAFPFFRDPQMLAYHLHLVAAIAVHHHAGADRDGIVAKYAAELVALWPEGAGLLDLQPEEAYADPAKMKYLLDRNVYLWYAAPVLSALGMAAKMVEPELAKQLQSRAAKVESEVKDALNSSERKKGGRGELMYNALFNPQPKA
ncbi:hypothetical protein C8A05DRAFT_34914 [Staphylotrichum tortipilum]|uniref:Uncharacterized protein n=1 Tax=Staphylotrichum tortipilum TaxID=2831512 RepID=A0AAN6RSZ6_9PEZI|nr:hypothetical protein C8A05DRAFT_34914 [Staphylotrichum longicolle]